MRRGLAALPAFLIFFSILLLVTETFAAQSSALSPYTSVCCSIHYRDAGHLHEFTLRIGGFRLTSNGLDQNPERVVDRVDEIMSRVQATLDMYPDDLHIAIRLYPDHDSLGKVYREFTLKGSIPLAFYAHKAKTIYVSADGVTVGVLAHEMAHAVINFYFPVPPPAKMQEILAQYVDLHIWD